MKQLLMKNYGIKFEKERSELYSPEQGNYIENSMDHYYYIYEDLISKEHDKKSKKTLIHSKLLLIKILLIFG